MTEPRKILRCKICHRELVPMPRTRVRGELTLHVACKNPECEDYGRVVPVKPAEDGPAAERTA
jgi:hypothetical protein